MFRHQYLHFCGVSAIAVYSLIAMRTLGVYGCVSLWVALCPFALSIFIMQPQHHEDDEDAWIRELIQYNREAAYLNAVQIQIACMVI